MRAISDSVYLTSQRVLRRKKELLKQGGESLAQEIGEGKDLMSTLRESHSGEMLALRRTDGCAWWVAVRENMMAHEGDKLAEEELLAQIS